MRKVCRFSFCVALLSTASVSMADSAPQGAANELKIASGTASPSSDWRSVVSGRLKNGVRFAVLPRQGHEPGLGLLLRIEGGFIAERRPGERGLAHLIEHVAFLSPTTGAPEDLHHAPHVGRGITLPAPSAGTTSWRETNYFFSTASTDVADLDKLLGLLREISTDLTFRRDAVDEARSQVIREMADRKLGNEIYASYVAATAPGSPNDVIDAQNSDDVPTATIETIRSLYERLYRPSNAMIVVVGNIDLRQARSLIERRFGDWTTGTPSKAVRHSSTFRPRLTTPISFSTRVDGRRSAMMVVVTPTPPAPSSHDRQMDLTLTEMLVSQAVNARMTRSQPDSAPGKTVFFIENGEHGYRQLMMWDNFLPNQWQSAVTGLSRTACDLGTTGFSDAEWEAARKELIRHLEEQTYGMAGVPNVDLAKTLSHELALGQKPMAPDVLLYRARILLPRISARAGSTWWNSNWKTTLEHIRVEAPELTQVSEPIALIRSTADDAITARACRVR